MRALAAAALFVLAGVSTSCSSSDRAPAGFAVRDSAGITIVENAAATWTEADRWRLSDEPVLVIGVAEGPEEYQLFRAGVALRLANGDIVVANAGTNEIRFYDSAGTFLRAAGGEGDGPGEFMWLADIWRLGSDSLLVFDRRADRASIFSAQGGFGRSFRMAQLPGRMPAQAAGVFEDGTLLGYSQELAPAGQTVDGHVRYPHLYGRFDRDGTLIDSLPRLFGWEIFYAPFQGGRIGSALPYGRIGSVAVSEDRWYYGSGESWEIAAYSENGRLTHLIRRAMPNRPVTAQMVEEYREAARASSSPGASIRVGIPIPETMPAYREFKVDDAGNLWVAEYTLDDEPPSWAVFDPEGRLLGTVATPAGGQVTHIATDFVLGIWQDEMEVQQVRMYRLIRP